MADPLATPAASTFRSGGSPPALRVEGLRKTYEDGFTAVAGLDLEIPDGAFFGLLGPNGAPYPNPLVADRAVDLLRVNSALCTAPGCARCRG
ncbi:hypothetical protein [Streptomyces sp. 142MFCol3.1]|uniref:hypothetical protein n=1 Tax=Streptomyces sp. 142MFCol3.1 TaxID=1172179 RepID=UPI0004007E9F|nr:hypothetical protein [Streptomyces sp. 142MFCol3.1]